jgi:hypothetical protein
MISKKQNTNNTLLKSKLTNSKLTKSKLTKSKLTKSKLTKKSKLKLKHKKSKNIIDRYCGYYKTGINGKINKNLYSSCKINKYCRKYKCQDIDNKMIKAKQTNIGFNYNKIIFDKIKKSCNQNITGDDKVFKKTTKQCANNAIKEIFKDNNLEELYNKSIECDKITCVKEQKIFNQNLFRQKQINLKKSQKAKIKENDLQNEVDLDLIQRGDL